MLLSATAVLSAARGAAHGKRHVARHWHGYGFLPGYRTPEQIEADEARHPNRVWWYGGAALLSRALERWRLRPVLDPDADRECVELRPIEDRNQGALRHPRRSGKLRRRSLSRTVEAALRNHSQTETRRIPQP